MACTEGILGLVSNLDLNLNRCAVANHSQIPTVVISKDRVCYNILSSRLPTSSTRVDQGQTLAPTGTDRCRARLEAPACSVLLLRETEVLSTRQDLLTLPPSRHALPAHQTRPDSPAYSVLQLRQTEALNTH
jgi:hypothetical protein